MMTFKIALPYKVECRSFAPFFEMIAAFDCREPADAYAAECQRANPKFEYRVRNCWVRGQDSRAA